MGDEQKRALVIVAHGSRRTASNEEIRDLAASLDANPRNDFASVVTAFLELAEPTIPDGIENCIQSGASEVIVFPYFLSAGRHVAQDIPAEVKIKQQQYPSVKITLASHLGIAKGIPELIFEHLSLED